MPLMMNKTYILRLSMKKRLLLFDLNSLQEKSGHNFTLVDVPDKKNSDPAMHTCRFTNEVWCEMNNIIGNDLCPGLSVGESRKVMT